jgi:hypothetical protein
MSALVSLFALWLHGAYAPAAATAAPTLPAIPAECADGGRKAKAHETGRQQGSSFVEAAWASAKRDCSARGRVEQAVREALAHRAPPARASEVVMCRNAGFETGAQDALMRILATCTDK